MTTSCQSLGEVLLHWSVVQGDKVFLYAPESGATLTYDQLSKETHRFSAWLQEQKISTHGHVGLYMHNGLQTSTIFLATMA